LNRPLVWVGIAYALGEGLAAAGCPAWAAAALTAVFTVLLHAGRRQISTFRCRYLYVLPVFILLGYLLLGACAYRESESLCAGGSSYAVFSGKVEGVQEKENSIALTIPRALIKTDGGGCESCGIVIYADRGSAARIEAGCTVSGRGTLDEPAAASDPGQFDMRAWYRAQGVQYTVKPDTIKTVQRSFTYRTLLGRIRNAVAVVFGRLFPEQEAGILDAMILGDRLLLSDEIRELFRIMGISHILAISGLHISLIGQGIYKLLSRTGLGCRPAVLLSSFAVLSYGVLSGMGASAQRAVIMFLVLMGAEYAGRSYDMLSAIALAELIIFIRQPLMITQSGVQFSFSAVIALGFLWPAYKGILPERWKKNRIVLRSGPTLSVLLLTLPLTAVYYGEIPLLSLPMNLLILPSMSLLVPMGALTGIIGLFSLTAAALPGGSVDAVLRLCTAACEIAAKLPFAVYRTGVPPAPVIALYYLLTALPLAAAYASADKVFTKMRAAVLTAGVILLLIPFRRFERFTAFLDVGQGDCVFMRSGRTTWLADGGSSDEDRIGEYRILPFLTYYGEDHVDYALVSHGDEDHISGVRELLEMSKIRHLVLTEAAREDEKCEKLAGIAAEKGIDVIYIGAGAAWSEGDWHFSCLYPYEGLRAEDSNDESMVLRVDAEGVNILLTGDISADAERAILARYDRLGEKSPLKEIDVLKCAHHGSKNSSCAAFLTAVSPAVSVISCGRYNRYGHPSPETVERLEAVRSRLEYTMDSGAVKITAGRGGPRISRYLQKTPGSTAGGAAAGR